MAVVTPQDLKNRGDVATLPLSDQDLFIVWQGGKLLSVDVGDIGVQGEQGVQGAQGIQGIQGIQGEKGDTGAAGVAESKLRETIVFSTVTAIPAGQTVPIEFKVFPSFDIQSVEVDGLLRLRLYANEASRTADILRPIRSPEPQGCGIKYEFISSPSLFSMPTQPEVSVSTGVNGVVYGSLTNTGVANQIYTITLVVLQKEALQIG